MTFRPGEAKSLFLGSLIKSAIGVLVFFGGIYYLAHWSVAIWEVMR